MKGYLFLETGDWFEGEWFGAEVEQSGEVVFQTGMTGYQEVITDPSYAGQIVNFTYPLIGNYGINTIDDQSIRPQVAGVIVAELCKEPSHPQYNQTFEQVLAKYQIPGLSGIDTRELTKLIRKHGSLRGMISKTLDSSLLADWKRKLELQEQDDQQFSRINLLPLVDQVSTRIPLFYPNQGPHVVVIDYGAKFSIIDSLKSLGCSVTVVPYNYPVKEILKLNPDGILLSNGPGDPKELTPLLPEIKKLVTSFPTLGICLGHQLLALSFGADTEKLPFGHRGVNHPVINLETNQVWMTSQNHGYVVNDESLKKTDFVVTHQNVNDQSVEGMKHRFLPIQSVQFHPEAHPGPIEAFEIFKTFVQLCSVEKGVKQYAQIS
ncbi:carbamoyl phosphate synthase small subunit [Tepidibacillus infernus]|uniref:Carbamoyl phosphate synthase small chain n=1 Tax=Tepidibacillus decaturensis TaxID=1413211 RepID=A0A135L5Z7_9BACI|nr:carbamoyl phosphate synthase small subunit [Tepidibacillus decaturensis]KXG44434.1 carbamoyl-phosphate synthase small subunit [Tepidibacillus decaturensis]